MKIQGPRFQRNYIIVRYPKSDLHGTSFQSSPKIYRMLITRLICIQGSLPHPTIASSYFFFEHSVVFTCYKVINAFKRKNSWTKTFRKSSKVDDSLIFPELSSQNMRGFDHETVLSPSFHGVHKERLAQWPPNCEPKTTKNSGGTSGKIGWGCAARSTLFQFWSKLRYPFSELTPWSPARDRSAWQAVTARTR